MVGVDHHLISMRNGVALISFMSLMCLMCEGMGYEKPKNCDNLECPVYDVVHSQNEFEIRTYKEDTWVATPNISSNSYKEASNEGFLKLFSYISGKNKEGKRLGMTAPVVVDVYSSNKSTGYSSFVVNFYLPKEFQKNPPHSDEVKLVKRPRFAAVKRFGGFAEDNNIAPQVSALKESLIGTPYKIAIDSSLNSVAVYNAPFETKNRVNEIILWYDYHTSNA